MQLDMTNQVSISRILTGMEYPSLGCLLFQIVSICQKFYYKQDKKRFTLIMATPFGYLVGTEV